MAKKKKGGDDGASGGEAALRGLMVSLFILLLAFFIVLNSLANKDESRAKAAMGSIRGAFSSISGGISLISEGGTDPLMFDDPMITDVSLRTHKIVGLDKKTSGKVLIRITPEGIVISILYEVLFIEGTYKIKPEVYPFLHKLCEIINEDTNPVIITGHTDSRPPEEKSVSSNWELSSRKAMEVLKFFVEQANVNPFRIRGYGQAEYHPISSNETRKTREQNSRIDITVDLSLRSKIKQIYEKNPSSFFLFDRFVFDIFGG